MAKITIQTPFPAVVDVAAMLGLPVKSLKRVERIVADIGSGRVAGRNPVARKTLAGLVKTSSITKVNAKNAASASTIRPSIAKERVLKGGSRPLVSLKERSGAATKYTSLKKLHGPYSQRSEQ
jgi:hypothetical protein